MEKQEVEGMTPIAKQIIKMAIKNANTTNRYDICEEVGKLLEERYPNRNRQYFLNKINMETPDNALKKIDQYMIELIATELKKGNEPNDRTNNTDT